MPCRAASCRFRRTSTELTPRRPFPRPAQLLHRFAVLQHRRLWPRHPWLYAWEYQAGNAALAFRGDLLLTDGAGGFLCVEAKFVKDPFAPEANALARKRLAACRAQAEKAEVFAFHFLAREAADSADGPPAWPAVEGRVLSNAFLEEHHADLAAAELAGVREAYAAFRAGLKIKRTRGKYVLRDAG